MHLSRIKHPIWMVILLIINQSLYYSCARPDSITNAGWPQANGPYGNFNPARYGCELVDDMAAIRKVWTSEDNDLGYAKTLNSILLPRAVWPGQPGSASGLIAAEGKIFASSFRPAGDVWAESELTPEMEASWSPELIKILKQNLRIDADDITLAIDAATGKTVWKAVEEHKGLCRGMRKWNGWGVMPVYHDGRVISMGTTGRLYAYSAKDGGKLWESNIGPVHRKWEAGKQQDLKEKTLPDENAMASLIVACGVLIVPLFDSLPDISLRGVDPANGRTLWELPAVCYMNATPAVWHHNGQEYVLVATHGDPIQHTGSLKLISPKEGKILWTVGGLANTCFSLAPSDRTVLVNVGSSVPDENGEPWIVLAAYRLSPEGAERAWTMPEDLETNHQFNDEDWRKYVIRDGKVYYNSRSFFIFDEETGEILYRQNTGDPAVRNVPAPGQIYLVEDRILHVPDPWHGARMTLQLWTADPQDFKRLCFNCVPAHTSTTAYNTFMEFPYVNGRIFMRTENGSVVCYDLRKPENAGKLNLLFSSPFTNRPDDQPPLGIELWIINDKPERGYITHDSSSNVQWPLAGFRRNVSPDSVSLTGKGLSGSLIVDVGFHNETWDVQLTREGDEFKGSYRRLIDALPESFSARGDIDGRVQWPEKGEKTCEMELHEALVRDKMPAGRGVKLSLILKRDSDGQWQCSAHMPGVNRADEANRLLAMLLEPEVDASKLTVKKDRLSGEITVILRYDLFNTLNMTVQTPSDELTWKYYHNRQRDLYSTVYFGSSAAQAVAAATYRINATIKGETIYGAFEGVIGREWSRSGTAAAKYAASR